jgi:hypothetical protein
MADSLGAEGYDEDFAFDWVQEVRQRRQGMTTVAANRLAKNIAQLAGSLPLDPGDVVDLHLIGHSRGGVVIGQALDALDKSAATPQVLSNGFFKMTMLDPHPSRITGSLAQGLLELLANTGVSNAGSFGYLPGLTFPFVNRNVASYVALAFQYATQDPLAYVPRNVDQAELFYQRNLWYNVPVTSGEWLLNLWGQTPSSIANFSTTALQSVNLGPGHSHTGVRDWYQNQVVPNLGTGG